MKEAEEEAFYVGIKDPIEIRRSILESSKDIVQFLQRAERFKAVRAEKAEQFAKLKEISKEIQGMIRKLRTALPKTKIRISLYERKEKIKEEAEKKKKGKIKEEKAAPAKVKKKEAPPEEKKEEASELEKLESELGEIESRLSRLD
jgi:hypothetical protein